MGDHSLSSSSSLMCGSLYAQVAQGPFQTHLILARRIVRNPVAGSANSIYPLCQNFKQTFVFYRIAQTAPKCSRKVPKTAQNTERHRIAPNCTESPKLLRIAQLLRRHKIRVSGFVFGTTHPLIQKRKRMQKNRFVEM